MRLFIKERVSIPRPWLNRKSHFVTRHAPDVAAPLNCIYYSRVWASSIISIESDISHVGSLAAKLLSCLFILYFEESCWYSVADLLILSHHFTSLVMPHYRRSLKLFFRRIYRYLYIIFSSFTILYLNDCK